MVKKILPILALFGISFATEQQPINIGSTNVDIIEFDGNKIGDAINDTFQNFIGDLLGQLGQRQQLNIPGADKILEQIFKGLFCPHLDLPNFSKSIQIPSSLSIALPCSTVRLDLSPQIQQAINNSGLPDIGMHTDDRIAACIRDIKSCNSKKFFRAIRAKNPIANMELEGLSSVNNYSEKPAKQVRQEMETKIDTMSIEDVQYLSGEPTKVRVNEASQNLRLNTMQEASSSFYQLPLPSKENFGDQQFAALKPYYNAIATKQINRKEYVASLIALLKRERQKLAQIEATLKGLCQLKWPVQTIPRQYTGGYVFKNATPSLAKAKANNLKNNIKNISDTEKKLVSSIKEQLIKSVELNDFVSLDIASLNPNKISRSCCECCCNCVKNAENSVKAKIEAAKNEIERKIEEAAKFLANVISQEQYATRDQINKDFQALYDLMKNLYCTKLYLEYQRNYLMTLQFETEIARLKVLYELLNKDEMEKWINLQRTIKGTIYKPGSNVQ
jgi:hypothetical protein